METCYALRQEANGGAPTGRLLCPANGRMGKKVAALTVRSLLVERRKNEASKDRAYRFCTDPACEVVYFAPGGWTARKEDLAVRVGIKETGDPIPVCYCFGYSRADIRREVMETGTSAISDWIAGEIKADRCACETMNPSGSCCLGEVRRLAQEAQREATGFNQHEGETAMSALSPESPAQAGEVRRRWFGLALGGALLSGFLASACCLGPLVLALLGLGGAGFLLQFAPYRPLLATLTLALLGVGFYLAYRKPRAPSASKATAGDDCGCALPRAKRTGTAMLWVVAALVLFFVLFPKIASLIWG